MPTIRSTWRRRPLPIVVLAGFLLGLVATAAAADPPSASGAVTRSNEPIGFFYEGDGFVLVGGPPFEEGCLGEGFLEPLISFVARGDGTTLARFQTDGEQIRIYEGDSFFEDVLFPSCDAIFDEDPATVPAQPIAIGSGRMSSRVRTEVDGIERVANWLNGKVVDQEGTRWHVRGHVRFTVTESGIDVQTDNVDLVPQGRR